MKRKNNWVYYAIGLIIGLALLIVVQIPDGKARLIACDVGQGDAILITKGSNQVLIDGGPSSEKILACLTRHIPFWDRHIELIVLTNTDFDHMNGLSTVLERYTLTTFVTADGIHESDALDRFIDVLALEHVLVQGVEQGESITVGSKNSLSLRVLWPPEVIDEYIAVFSGQYDNSKREQILGASAKRGDLNERSVVLLLETNGYKVLLTGDTGDQAEKELLHAGILPDIDLLKVGHHGSKYASSQEFLEKVRPELAVISVGEKNRYGHPTPETIGRLSTVGATIYRTDQIGDVIMVLE